MFWKKSEALKKLEDILQNFIFGFQDIMADEFEQFHSVQNNADDSSLPTQEDLIHLTEKELLSFEKSLEKSIEALRSSSKIKMSQHNQGFLPPANASLVLGHTEGFKTDAERTMDLAKRHEQFLEEFLKSKS